MRSEYQLGVVLWVLSGRFPYVVAGRLVLIHGHRATSPYWTVLAHRRHLCTFVSPVLKGSTIMPVAMNLSMTMNTSVPFCWPPHCLVCTSEIVFA